MSAKYIIGIDEVGRGPLAGPVVVGLCAIKKESIDKIDKLRRESFRDSKKLSEKKRYEWYKWMRELEDVYFEVSFQDSSLIDKIGIVPSIKKAISELLQKAEKNLNSDDFEIRLDGGLVAPEKYKNQQTIIKGDEKEFTIALASIYAKVSRDEFMKLEAVKFPFYAFEANKGYGTKAHRDAIKEYGLSKIHRVSFCKNMLK